MDNRSLSLEIHGLSKTIRRYLTTTMPERARIATDGNAHIIMFLARNRDRDVYQHDIEKHFCITRSTASRVLALMEKKGLITRDSVESDARVKRITLTDTADAIVADLSENAKRMENHLLAGFSADEKARLNDYLRRMQTNIETAEHDLAADDTTNTKEEGK